MLLFVYAKGAELFSSTWRRIESVRGLLSVPAFMNGRGESYDLRSIFNPVLWQKCSGLIKRSSLPTDNFLQQLAIGRPIGVNCGVWHDRNHSFSASH